MFLARAIVVYAKRRGQRQTRLLCSAEDLPGFGARARVNGHEVIIGSTETLAEAGITAYAVWIAVDRGGSQKDEYG